jgi:small nuclear ribonucleoprotein (snRNP)-like protein
VTVDTRDGNKYQGLLHTLDPASLSVALKWVTNESTKQNANKRPTPSIIINNEDILHMKACISLQQQGAIEDRLKGTLDFYI